MRVGGHLTSETSERALWHMVNSPVCFVVLEESVGSRESKVSILSLCGLA